VVDVNADFEEDEDLDPREGSVLPKDSPSSQTLPSSHRLHNNNHRTNKPVSALYFQKTSKLSSESLRAVLRVIHKAFDRRIQTSVG